jgi:hypothetical protein
MTLNVIVVLHIAQETSRSLSQIYSFVSATTCLRLAVTLSLPEGLNDGQNS